MALLYYLYQTNSGNTVIDRSETSFGSLPPNTAEIQYDILIPENQPLYYYKEDSSAIVPNDQTTIDAYTNAIYPPTEDDYVDYNTYTGYTTANDIRVTNIDNDVTYVSGVTSGNTTNISTNASNIADNADDITYVSGVTSGNTVAISDNAGDITSLSGDTTQLRIDVDANSGATIQNTSDIQLVSGETTTNAGNISTNASDIQLVSGETTQNTLDISGNTQAISDNAGDITYLSGQTDLKLNITDYNIYTGDTANDLAFLSGVTSGNTVAIANNAGDITFLSGATDINSGDIVYISGETAANDADIIYLSGATEQRVRWKNIWTGGTYNENDMVRDGTWTMIANSDTSDIPSPQAVGPERYLYYPLVPSGTSTNAKQIVFGMQYSGDSAYWINGYRVYVTAGNFYEIISVQDPTGANQANFINSFTAEVTGWREFSLVPRPVPSGTSYQILAIVHEPDPTPITLTYNYDYIKPNNVEIPLTGEITQANKDVSSLLINRIDDDSVDRSSFFSGLTIGDFIVIGNTRWAIQAITPEITYFDFTVAPARQSIVSGVQPVEFETTIASTLSYGKDPNYWSGSTQVKGVLGIDTGWENAILDDSQYGIDILVQDAYISPDWDFVASQGTGGGSSSDSNAVWGYIGGDIEDQPDLQNQFGTKVNVSGDTMTGDLTTTSLFLTNPNTGGTLNDWFVRYDPITNELRTIDTGSGSTQTTYCYTDRRDTATNATDVNASYLSESWDLTSGYYEYEYNAHFGQGNFNRCATVCFMMDGAVVGSCNLMKTNDGSVITTAYVTQNNQLSGGTYQPEILFREIGGGTASVYYGSIRVQKIAETG